MLGSPSLHQPLGLHPTLTPGGLGGQLRALGCAFSQLCSHWSHLSVLLQEMGMFLWVTGREVTGGSGLPPSSVLGPWYLPPGGWQSSLSKSPSGRQPPPQPPGRRTSWAVRVAVGVAALEAWMGRGGASRMTSSQVPTRPWSSAQGGVGLSTCLWGSWLCKWLDCSC